MNGKHRQTKCKQVEIRFLSDSGLPQLLLIIFTKTQAKARVNSGFKLARHSFVCLSVYLSVIAFQPHRAGI